MNLRGTVWGAGMLLAAAVGSGPLAAQSCNREVLDFDCPEAWGMKYYTSVSLLTGFGPPERRDAGAVELALEGGWVPQLSDDERRLGFNGTKLEDTNKTPVFGRVRATVWIANGLSLSAGVVPPLEVGGARPLLVSFGAGLPLLERRSVRIGARAFGQVGRVEGDITCDAETVSFGADPVRNPFGCEAPSEDEVTERYAGVEIAAAFPRGRVEPYVGGSLQYLDMVFGVRARYSGLEDRRDLAASGWTGAGTAGVRVRASEAWSLSGEAFYSPLGIVRPTVSGRRSEALFNLRGMVSWRIR